MGQSYLGQTQSFPGQPQNQAFPGQTQNQPYLGQTQSQPFASQTPSQAFTSYGAPAYGEAPDQYKPTGLPPPPTSQPPPGWNDPPAVKSASRKQVCNKYLLLAMSHS